MLPALRCIMSPSVPIPCNVPDNVYPARISPAATPRYFTAFFCIPCSALRSAHFTAPFATPSLKVLKPPPEPTNVAMNGND